MSLKDRFDKFIDYFTEDGEDVSTAYQPKAEEPIVTPDPFCSRVASTSC